MKKRLKISLFCLLGFILLVGLSYVGLNVYTLCSTPKSYLCENENYFEYQSGLECSGYSTAYVFRSFGDDCHGLDIYHEITPKNENGTVDINVLVAYIQKEGYKVTKKTGTITQMKRDISMGIPVIAFVKVDKNSFDFHYLPIVGYNEKTFYAADSLFYMVNEKNNEHYNRVLSEEELKIMLKTGVMKDNTYLVISK